MYSKAIELNPNFAHTPSNRASLLPRCYFQKRKCQLLLGEAPKEMTNPLVQSCWGTDYVLAKANSSQMYKE